MSNTARNTLQAGLLVAACLSAVVWWLSHESQPSAGKKVVASPAGNAHGDSGTVAGDVAEPAHVHRDQPGLDPVAPAMRQGMRLSTLRKAGLPPEKEAFAARVLEDLRQNVRAGLRARTQELAADEPGARNVAPRSDWLDDLRAEMRARLAEGLTEEELARVLREVGDNPLTLLAYELPKQGYPLPPNP